MKTETNKSHRINSVKHLKELIQGKYFTFEYEEGKTFHQWGLLKLVAESYRIPNKVKEQLPGRKTYLKNVKRILIFDNYAQARKYIDYNMTWHLPRYKYSWMPIIIAAASTDRILYHGAELMKYWLKAKKAKDEEGKRYYALGERWRYLYRFGNKVREDFQNL